MDEIIKCEVCGNNPCTCPPKPETATPETSAPEAAPAPEVSPEATPAQ